MTASWGWSNIDGTWVWTLENLPPHMTEAYDYLEDYLPDSPYLGTHIYGGYYGYDYGQGNPATAGMAYYGGTDPVAPPGFLWGDGHLVWDPNYEYTSTWWYPEYQKTPHSPSRDSILMQGAWIWVPNNP